MFPYLKRWYLSALPYLRVLCGCYVAIGYIFVYAIYHIVRYLYAVMPLFYLGCIRRRITAQYSRYAVRLSGGYFHYNNALSPTDWYHLALVFHGPNHGQGISIYHDGILIKNDTTKALRDRDKSHGTVVIGKLNTDTD